MKTIVIHYTSKTGKEIQKNFWYRKCRAISYTRKSGCRFDAAALLYNSLQTDQF